jgi:hypothetical protein
MLKRFYNPSLLFDIKSTASFHATVFRTPIGRIVCIDGSSSPKPFASIRRHRHRLFLTMYFLTVSARAF